MRKISVSVLTFYSALCGAESAGASSSWTQALVPDYLVVQTSAYLGWIAVGGGYELADGIFNLALLYGYVPERYGGTEIQTGTLKMSVSVPKLATQELIWTPFSLGIANIYTHHNTFIFPPDYYPRRTYYPPTAIRNTLWAGTALEWEGKYGGWGVFGEWAVLDLDLIAYLRYPGLIKFTTVVRPGIGIFFRL